MFIRNIGLEELLSKKSILLLGPRATGKSFYIREQLGIENVVNLLRSEDFLRYQSNPGLLGEYAEAHPENPIAIDEIQKVPALLDEVHRLIEEKKRRFLITGSSARKLKGDGVNLLAGRAWLASMCPLNFWELGEDFSVERVMSFGSLPGVYSSSDPLEELDAYVQSYIESEIKAEGLVRKIPAFSRFLKTASLSAGELINFQNIASDSEVPAPTVREHYQILEDTLLGYQLPPWKESRKRKALQASKFFFFDIGVLNQISQVFPKENTSTWGNRFEHFIVSELRCANIYQRRKQALNYWRSTSGFEVDLILGDMAVEIKGTRKIHDKHLKGLRALKEEAVFKKYIVVSFDPLERKTQDSIYCMDYRKFLKRLWSGSL